LLPSNDARRCEYLARLSLSLMWALGFAATLDLSDRVADSAE